MMRLLKHLFNSSQPVTRRQYLVTGFLLFGLKYAVDSLAYRDAFGKWWDFWDYLSPIFAYRMGDAPSVRNAPPEFLLFMIVWGLTFAWIGCAWSSRRAIDAGQSAWWGILFFVPLVNYLLIVALACTPTAKGAGRYKGLSRSERDRERAMPGVIMAGSGFFAMVAVAYVVMVEGTGSYGIATFTALPVVLGLGVGYLANRKRLRGAGETVWLGTLSAVVACLALLLFALEGVLCITMAFPLIWGAVAIGALLGRTFADVARPRAVTPVCLVVALPISAWLESEWTPIVAREVSSHVIVDAPPSVVWKHVVEFSELPEPDGWVFETGIAYPLRARIEGSGVGAIRHCEFSTGAFVEPITVWNEPRKLGFDVIEQPETMEEWSFYANVHPPHLESTFRSVRGEFRLAELPHGRTRLEGSTWYQLDMAPEAYWRFWGDAVIHRIHDRVLTHVKSLSEQAHASDSKPR